MRKQYFAPLCEAMNINASCDLLAGSGGPTPTPATSLPVVNIYTDITAD